MASTHRFRDHGNRNDDLKRRRMVAVADVEKDARTQPHAVALASVQARGILHVPVTEHGRIVALLLLKRSWPEKDQRRREWVAYPAANRRPRPALSSAWVRPRRRPYLHQPGAGFQIDHRLSITRSTGGVVPSIGVIR